MFTHIILVGAVLVALVLAGSLFVYVYSKLDAKAKEDLDQLAQKAIVLVEQKAHEYEGTVEGQTKRKEALDLVDSWVNKKFHTKFTPDQIEAAIQFGFHLLDKKNIINDITADAKPIKSILKTGIIDGKSVATIAQETANKALNAANEAMSTASAAIANTETTTTVKPEEAEQK
jgi:hypothetical protein